MKAFAVVVGSLVKSGTPSSRAMPTTVSGVYGFCTLNPYPGTGYGRGGTWNLTPSGREKRRLPCSGSERPANR
jgi:hypothetical protein